MRVVLFYPKTPVHESSFERLEGLVGCGARQAVGVGWMFTKERETTPPEAFRGRGECVWRPNRRLPFITPTLMWPRIWQKIPGRMVA